MDWLGNVEVTSKFEVAADVPPSAGRSPSVLEVLRL
jgi:hypothetical protein